MRIYEHEAKKLFEKEGMVIPKSYGLVRKEQDLSKLKAKYPAMIKAQVLIGGRGKAGAVKRATSEKEGAAFVREILGLKIGDYPVECILIEDAAEFSGSCYLGITVNPATSNSVIMASAAGGVEIEQVAKTQPEAILRLELPDNPETLPKNIANEIGAFLCKGLESSEAKEEQLAQAATQLYAAYQRYDCKVAEINPLLITKAGPLAADAKMVLDDNALYRQGEMLAALGIESKRHDVAEPTARERRAAAAGFFYVDLFPEDAKREPGKIYVGLVPGGAGYGIFSIDEVTNVGDEFFGGKVVPVNFMDSGGGPTRQGVGEMFSLLMDHPLVDVIITSRFGGISSCDIFIRGLVDCLRDRAADKKRIVPIYGRMVGTDLAAGRAYLEAALRETPEELKPLSMVVGNREIMVEVIREGLLAFVGEVTK
ncbi:MAG: ATP-grasp domain-containing protein [Pseudomonadota bacterium]